MGDIEERPCAGCTPFLDDARSMTESTFSHNYTLSVFEPTAQLRVFVDQTCGCDGEEEGGPRRQYDTRSSRYVLEKRKMHYKEKALFDTRSSHREDGI